MHILNSEDNASGVKLAIFCGQEPNFFHYIVEVFSCNVLAYSVEMIFCLECATHLNQKWVADRIQDLTLLIYKFLNFIFL